MNSSEYLTITSDPSERAKRYEDVINTYYDWATTYLPPAWGSRLHFARFEGDESFKEACIKQEEFLLLHLDLSPGMRVLDMGSGLGAPARFIANRSGAHITGVDLSEKKVALAREQADKEGVNDLCDFQVENIVSLPYDDNSFDAIYSIEVGAHIPEKTSVF